MHSDVKTRLPVVFMAILLCFELFRLDFHAQNPSVLGQRGAMIVPGEIMGCIKTKASLGAGLVEGVI